MKIMAIDPGPVESAWVRYDDVQRFVADFGKQENWLVLKEIEWAAYDALVIEMVASFGKPVGMEVFETCVWIGQFLHARPKMMADFRLTRHQIKMHLCGATQGVNDAVIRQRLIDLFGPGKQVAVGTKAKPGPLYEIKGDVWQALAVAVVFSDLSKKGDLSGFRATGQFGESVQERPEDGAQTRGVQGERDGGAR